MPNALLGLDAHPLAVVADVVGQPLGAVPDSEGGRSGLTGGRSANFGGISHVALETNTATGLRSEPCARRPSRYASRGDRAAAAERVADGWYVLPQIAQYRLCVVGWRRCLVAGAGQGAGNLEPRLVQDSWVVGRLPWHHLGDDCV